MSSFELFETSFGRDNLGQQNKGTERTSIDDMNAIACGVTAWFEENAGYSENITGMTVEIARRMGVPERDIKKWLARRSNLNAVRVRPIKSLLERLYREPENSGLNKVTRTREV